MLATDTGIGSRPRTDSEEELLELLEEVEQLARDVNYAGRYHETEARNLLWRLRHGHAVKVKNLPETRRSHSQMTAMLEAQKAEKARQESRIEEVA